MPIILSLSQYNGELWAAGPEGLFCVEDGELTSLLQPQAELACCAVTDTHLLVGGAPHGVAFTADKANWQAAWMDGVPGPVLCLAVDPRVEETGVVLAGSMEGGVLRSHNRGRTWTVCNFGLQDFVVLSLAWAPPAPPDRWPRWEVVFAGTESGLYRSPNGGRGWRRVDGMDAVAQVIAVAPDFHRSGLVLVGTEDRSLWRSADGGHSFARVEGAPDRVDALTATADGWLLSDDQGLLHSPDGLTWTRVDGATPALILLNTKDGVWAGNESGIARVEVASPA